MRVADAAQPALPPELLKAFPPAPDALLDLLRARVDDEMLDEMSRADNGEDAEYHLREGRHIRDSGTIRETRFCVPTQVLEAVRGWKPDDPQSGARGERGHLMRAFSCAALLRAATTGDNAGYIFEEPYNAAQLVSSALVLERDVQLAAARFFAWRIPGMGENEGRAFFAFALLLLAVLLREDRLSDAALADAAEWMRAEEAAGQAALHPRMVVEGAPWLLRLEPLYQQYDSVWRAFARRLAQEADALTEPTRSTLQTLVRQLVE